MEKKELLKEQGNTLIKQESDLKDKILAFIKNAMKELKDIRIFDNFDKDNGEFLFDNDGIEEGISEITNSAPIISVDDFMTSQDMYLVGVRYEENKDNARYPYTIWLDCVPYDEISYVKFIRLEDVYNEYYGTIMNFITENL